MYYQKQEITLKTNFTTQLGIFLVTKPISCGLTSLLLNGHWRSFPGDKAAGVWRWRLTSI